MLNINELMKNKFFSDNERLEILENEFIFLQNCLKMLFLTKEERENIYKQCDLIVEKKREIVEKLKKLNI